MPLAPPASPRPVDLRVGAHRRTALVVAAAGTAADGADLRPLVVVAHGSRQSGATHRRLTGGAYDALTARGAVVVYLDAHGTAFDDGRVRSHVEARRDGVDDLAYVRAVVEHLRRTHRVDPHQVVAAGYSNGGGLAMRLLREAPEVLAGAVVVAATLPAPHNLLHPGAVPAPVPLTLVHGTADRVVPYRGPRAPRWAEAYFKAGGALLTAPATAAWFAAHRGATGTTTTTEVPSGPVPGPGARAGRTRVERTVHHVAHGAPVVGYTVHGGGHTVPGTRRPGVPRPGRTTDAVHVVDLVAGTLRAVRAQATSTASARGTGSR